MKNKLFIVVSLLWISMLGFSCSSVKSEKVELVISAAASLSDALYEVKQSYENKMPNVKLQLNLGASGALQQQIEQGAPVDIYLSAATSYMDALIEKQL